MMSPETRSLPGFLHIRLFFHLRGQAGFTTIKMLSQSRNTAMFAHWMDGVSWHQFRRNDYAHIHTDFGEE